MNFSTLCFFNKVLLILSYSVCFSIFSAFAEDLEQRDSFGQARYKINLKSAMDLAVQHSYNLKAAEASSHSAQYSSDQAFRALGPNLSGSATHVWQSADPDSNSLKPTQQNLTSQGTLTLTQPLFGLLSLKHTLDQKNISFHISKILETASKIQSALVGAQYYLNYQLALQQVAIAQANITTLNKSKQDSESLFQTGSIYKDDYLRILLQYTQAQQTLSAAKYNLNIAQFSLAQSLGINNPESMQIEKQVASYWESNNFSIPNLETSKIIALKQNQNIEAAEENIHLAQITKTILQDNYIPSVNLFASYTKNFNSYSIDNGIVPDINRSYGFQLTWNIWDWGVRSSENSALTELIYNKKYQSEAQKETVLNNVVSQYYAMLNNLSAVTIAKDSVATSQEAFQLVSFRFLNGQVSALDLVTAQQNLTTSQADLAQSRFNLDLAWLTFQTVLGKNPSI